MLTTYDVRWACDVLRPVVRRAATASTAGCPSRSTRGWPTTPTRPSPRPRRCGGWSTGPTCSSRSRRPRRACRRSPQTLAEGISVNVTLIFSLDRYDAVMDAFLAGLEQAKANGHDLSQHRLGGVVLRLPRRHRDRQAAGQDRHRRGQGAARQGRHRQRPAGLRALRGGLRRRPLEGAGRRRRQAAAAAVGVDRRRRTRPTTTPCTSIELVAPGTVNTMPEATLDAVADHGEVRGDTVTGAYDAGPAGRSTSWPRSASTTTTSSQMLEGEGVEKFEDSLERAARRRRSQLEAAPKQARAERRGRQRPMSDLLAAVRPPAGSPCGGRDGARGASAARRRGRRARLLAGKDPTPVGAGGRGRGGDPAGLGGRRPAAAASCCRSWPSCARSCRRRLDHVVLAGMGGSSLAPEVICPHRRRRR